MPDVAAVSRIHPTPWLIEHPYASCERRALKGMLKRSQQRDKFSRSNASRATIGSVRYAKSNATDMSASLPTAAFSGVASQVNTDLGSTLPPAGSGGMSGLANATRVTSRLSSNGSQPNSPQNQTPSNQIGFGDRLAGAGVEGTDSSGR